MLVTQTHGHNGNSERKKRIEPFRITFMRMHIMNDSFRMNTALSACYHKNGK